jgi:hypothetical protein
VGRGVFRRDGAAGDAQGRVADRHGAGQ